MGSAPRKHHYLPAFYLAGFTLSGDPSGDLHVFDQSAVKDWISSPEKSATQRDFYAVKLGPKEDPAVMERVLGRLETEFSRVVRRIVTEQRLPHDDDFQWFLNLVALMVVRIPQTRELVARVTDAVLKKQMREVFASSDGWTKFKQVLAAQGKLVDDDAYEEYRKFALNDTHTVDLDRTAHVQMMVHMIDPLLPPLAARHWSLGVADNDAPDYICSDVPVSGWPGKDADRSKPLTIQSPHTLITFPLTRRLIALGTFDKQPPVVGVHERGVAGFNTFTATRARQLFSAQPDFTYLGADQSIRRKADLVAYLQSSHK